MPSALQKGDPAPDFAAATTDGKRVSLADYRDGRYFRAGSILTVATNFKLLPVVFYFTQ